MYFFSVVILKWGSDPVGLENSVALKIILSFSGSGSFYNSLLMSEYSLHLGEEIFFGEILHCYTVLYCQHLASHCKRFCHFPLLLVEQKKRKAGFCKCICWKSFLIYWFSLLITSRNSSKRSLNCYLTFSFYLK